MRAIFVFLLAASALSPQMIIIAKKKAAGCTTPTGTLLTESFGDASTSCWTSGPSTCNNTWTIGAGSGASIISSPGTPPADTACSNSLQLVRATGDYMRLPVSAIAATTAIDWYAYIYISAHNFADFAHTTIFTVDRDTTPDSAPRARILVLREGAALSLRGYGDDLSSTETISLSTWYKVRLHLEPGSAASYMQINDGTTRSFTQSAYQTNYVSIGTTATNSTWTVAVGAMKID